MSYPNRVGILDSELNRISSSNPLNVLTVGSLIPEDYDYISLGYTGDDLTTVTYKIGGSGGTTVATLTLGYSGGNLASVERS